MHAVLCLTMMLGPIGSSPIGVEPAGLGTLWPRDQDWCFGLGQPYHPQEGDLVFTSSTSPFFFLAYGVARTSHPWHVGIVSRDECGQLCLFESGGGVWRRVSLGPLEPRLFDYLESTLPRRIWVRRIKAPLTPAQISCLRAFSQAQDGKHFTRLVRIGMIGLPYRPLGPTRPDQDRWFCAELVCQSIRECELCCSGGVCPEKTTPRDLFFDKVDISCGWWPPETWSPTCCPPPRGPVFAPR